MRWEIGRGYRGYRGGEIGRGYRGGVDKMGDRKGI